MKDRLRMMGRLALFWMGFFTVARFLFLVYHWNQLTLLSGVDVAIIFALGSRMDLAMTGYWLLLPCLLMAIPNSQGRILFYMQNFVTLSLLAISITLVTVDLELYSHWGFRMNTTPLFYISREAVGSIQPGAAILITIIFILTSAGFGWIYWRIIAPKFLTLEPLTLSKVPLMVFVTGFLILPIRSSISVAPLNSGVVYFHKTMAFPNHAGINVTWNFLNDWLAQDEAKYPTNFYPFANSEEVLHRLTTTYKSPPLLFHDRRPNIVLIIMESFTAKIIEPLGGLKGVTPQLNGLVKEGILFDNFYASGDRTDKGLVAVLSGYPAQPLTSIIKFPEKTNRLPYLSRSLSHLGYHTSFVYGGDIGFANMESYLTTAGFSHITDDDAFDGYLTTKWGVPDHVVFDQLRKECDSASAPFFKVMLSLSSHEPFDVPMKAVIQGNDERTLFLNACYYADQSLGEFIRQAKKEPWWNRTIVVITADHGHNLPDNSQELKEKERFHTPLLLLGGSLMKRDTIIHTLGGQTDIANTLLGQVGQTNPEFSFSKDLLAPDVKSFTVYVFNNGYGFIDSQGETIYDFDLKAYVKDQGLPANKEQGKAYMQTLFSDYSKN